MSNMNDDAEGGEDAGDGTQRSRLDTNRSGSGKGEHQQLSTHPDEDVSTFTEQPIEDRVYLINTVAEGQRVWVLHQAAARVLRKDMATVLKKSIKELDSIENEEFLAAVESHSVDVEKNFIKMFSSEETKEFDAVRAKFFGGSTLPIPTFDFELN